MAGIGNFDAIWHLHNRVLCWITFVLKVSEEGVFVPPVCVPAVSVSSKGRVTVERTTTKSFLFPFRNPVALIVQIDRRAVKLGLLRRCKKYRPDQYYMSINSCSSWDSPFGFSWGFVVSSQLSLISIFSLEGAGDVETASYVAAFPATLC